MGGAGFYQKRVSRITPLHLAVLQGSMTMMRILIHHGDVPEEAADGTVGVYEKLAFNAIGTSSS